MYIKKFGGKVKKGFTLVELVIVIAILAILALYALPKYRDIIAQARSSEARAQLGSFRSALGIYYAKNHGLYPAYNIVNSGAIFASGTVPVVEITGVHGIVARNNIVRNRGHTVPITTFSYHPEKYGCWGYAVTTARDKADVRLNSRGVDPTTGKHWYEY